MKHLKKVMTLVLAVFTALAVATPAFADPAEKSITITGLAEGDNVKYYKVVEWNETTGWTFVAPYATALSDAQKAEILGNTTTAGKITDATATAMAGAAADPIVAAGDTLAAGATSWSKTNQEPGLYMALITAAAPKDGNDMVVYNPVFLAVQADGTGSEVATTLSYADSGTAKKSTVTVDKKAKGSASEDWAESTTQNVGDIIDFKVEATVPAYLDSWTNPVFTVKDELSDGLTLAVKDGEGAAALSDITVTGATTGEMTEGTQYTVTKSASGYTITFADSYLKGRTVAELVTITYKAKITDDAANVNPETNTVTIEYSKNPTSASDHGTKKDKTTHYTFSIDAGLQGDSQYTTSEIIKVGKNADGTDITETKTYSNKTVHHPLDGAKFKIYTDAACTQAYTNSSITADTEFTTANGGLINISGLDEGTYYLKETSPAPGYMLITDKLKFVISATYKTHAATDDCNAYQELDTYSVAVSLVKADGSEQATGTSNYTLDNGTIKKTNEVAGDVSSEIVNTKGQSLPSTGGMGTKILYTIGGLMVAAGGVFLAAKKRMNTIQE